ncbi:MAG: L,D-transpeptidase [Hyphomicrobiaceae bacterium]
MRATSLLATVAAGLLSLSAASAEERAANAGGESPAPKPTAVVDLAARSAVPAAKPAEALPQDTAASVTTTAAEATARPAQPRAVEPSLRVTIDLTAQRMHLTYDGKSQDSWPISSGRSGYPTPRGVFRPQWASRMWYSKKYDNAPMPHAVFFSGGVAVHGTQSVGLLGQPASHGCVRLAPANAARFFALVHKHGFGRTRISVIGTPPAARIAKRETPPRTRQAANWQQPANPWSQPWSTAQQPKVRRAPNGVVYLPPGSPYRGQPSFVLNGVTYVRVR